MIVLSALLVVLAGLPTGALAVDFRLRWQPSSSPGVVRYNIYVRQQSQAYGAPIDASLPPIATDGTMSYTVTGYAAGSRYCLAVSAETADGHESSRSNEICSCTADSQCNDANACNGVETCQGGACLPGAAPSCDDSNPCTTDGCGATSGCSHTAISGCQSCGGVVCGDGNPCNGTETCQSGVCTTIPPPSCNDGNVCTTDACSAPGGCTHTLIGGCQVCSTSATSTDGNPCNGGETCQNGRCQPGAPPDCDDGDPCTTDTCAAPGGCDHETLASCAECQTATPAGLLARRITLVPSIYGIRMTVTGVLQPAGSLDPTVTGVTLQIADAGTTLYNVFVPPTAFLANRAGTAFRLDPRAEIPGADRIGKLRIRVRPDGSSIVIAKGVATQLPGAFPTRLTWMMVVDGQCGLDSCMTYERTSDCIEE